MSEENNNQPQEEQVGSPQGEVAPPTERNEEVIPVEWDLVRETYELRQEQFRIQEYVSKFLLELEKQKADLLARLSMVENRVFESASEIRDKMNIDRNSAYELKMPDTEGAEAYFIRKQ